MDRKTLFSLLGRMPTKPALSLKVAEEVDCGTYVRRKVSYLVEAGERITAYLCLPTVGCGPFPAVFCFHQHGGNRLLGKSEVVGLAGSPDQAYASELAERGYVTLAPDAICFEERADPEEPVYFHLHQLHTRLVKGETLLGKVLFDMSVGLDLLESLPEVDRSRLGFIGHSYGGRAALFAPVYDRRIKAAVCNCGSTNFKDMLKHDTGVQFDFVVPGFLEHGDLEDVVRLVEPASLLILGTDDDKWSLGIKEMVEYARPAFNQGTLAHRIFPGQHQFTPPMREQAYRFLDEQLKAQNNYSRSQEKGVV